MSSYSHFFSKKFQHICVSLDVNFNESLTNDIVSFEQLGPEVLGQTGLSKHCVDSDQMAQNVVSGQGLHLLTHSPAGFRYINW